MIDYRAYLILGLMISDEQAERAKLTDLRASVKYVHDYRIGADDTPYDGVWFIVQRELETNIKYDGPSAQRLDFPTQEEIAVFRQQITATGIVSDREFENLYRLYLVGQRD